MIKLIVFDLDGTLLHTVPDLTASVNYACTKIGVDTVTEQHVTDVIGHGTRQLMKDITNNHPDAYKYFWEHYGINYCNKTVPYDGVIELLNYLTVNGIKLAVNSNKDDVLTKSLVDKLLGGYFSVVIGQRQGVGLKPDPQSLHEILEQLAIPASETLYVGDSSIDVLTAHNGGVNSASVSYGYDTVPELNKAGATAILDNVEKLTNYIKQLVG